MSDASSIAALLTQTITANARSSGAAKAEIVVLPQLLQALEQAATLRGQIAAIAEDGTVTINTDKGQVVIRTDQSARLQEGAAIEIKIESGNPPAQALLRPAPQQTSAPATPQTEQSLPHINLPQTVTLANITNGAPLEVRAYSPAQGITQPYIEPLQSSVAPLPTLNTSIQSPTINGSINTTSATQAQSNSLTLSLAAPLSAPTDIPDITLKPITPQITTPFRSIAAHILTTPLQDMVTNTYTPDVSRLETIQIERIAMADYTPAPRPETSARADNHADNKETFALLNTRAGTTHAVLEGFTQNQNFAVLRITAPYGLSDQHYALQVPIEDIPVGAKITLNILKTAQNPTTTLPLPALTAPYYLTPSLWPIFQEMEHTLTQVSPQAAQVFNAVLPNAAAPSQLGTGVLFFVAAMRSGDIQGWLGDKTLEVLKRAGKADLMGRLGREMSGLARMNADTISGDWRGLSLPLAWQNDIHKIAIHYRREDDNDDDANGAPSGNKTRFVMDLDLSQMGKVQLDGLFTRQSESVGRLELVLRTEQGFTQSMKQEMRQAYKNALSETQITGELSFHGQPDSWVRITPDTVKEYAADV
tara:strand:+ start:4529 stop:6301 length:1773 start_codon:yes stop_codon:yes gene_type:complete